MRAGDLLINGVEIGGSFATDDPYSPINNANGSAIAKAAAINRKAAEGSGPVGESQAITFSGNPIPGVLTVGGVSVELTAMENTPALAVAKIAEAMRTSAQFGQGSGRTVNYAPGSTIINVDFPITDGQVSAIDVQQRDTNLSSVTDTTRQYSSSSAGTGVFAKVNENIFTGKAMSGNSVVSGVVFINGYASGYSPIVYAENVESMMKKFGLPRQSGAMTGGQTEMGELTIEETNSKRILPAGIFARWSHGTTYWVTI